MAGCGTQTAGLSFGGYVSTWQNRTEEYNGSSWCTAGNLLTARQWLAGCGTQTAGLSFGGSTTTQVTTTTEEYNLVVSGTWIVDFDSGSATSHWGYLSWTNVGGGSVKARCKSATSQANLTGATWYPTGGSGYYETQPQDVECPHNEWYRLEVTLTEGSTPEVTEINQNYGEDC